MAHIVRNSEVTYSQQKGKTLITLLCWIHPAHIPQSYSFKFISPKT